MAWALLVTIMVVLCASGDAFRALPFTHNLVQTNTLSSVSFQQQQRKHNLLTPLTMTPNNVEVASSSMELNSNNMNTNAAVASKPTERKTMKKLLPLGAMLFFILFNYTILRDTKDVLVVTAPNSGAEIIPFLKTYVNLPSAIGFTILYSSLTNKMPADKVFYLIMSSFLSFFGAFATMIYPNRDLLHPNAAADFLTKVLPPFFVPLIAIFRNWTYALFYTLANLWGSVVVSLLFWGFANDITTVDEAKKYYPLFGLMANVALIFSGQYVKYVSSLRSGLPAGADYWGHSLKMLMGAVVGGGAVVIALMMYMQKFVLTDPACIDPNKEAKRKKLKTKMTFW